MLVGLGRSPVSVLSQKFIDEVSPDVSGRKRVARGVRSCEIIEKPRFFRL
jgi:hypothetical protein